MESVYFNISTSLTNMRKMLSLSLYYPRELNVVKGILSNLSGVHIETINGETKIFSIASSLVTELRGEESKLYINGIEFMHLMNEIAQPGYSPPDSTVLGHLYELWYERSNNLKDLSLVSYISSLDLANQTPKRLIKIFPLSIRSLPSYANDLKIIMKVIDDGEIIVR